MLTTNLITYKQEILNELESAFRAIAGKNAPLFVAVDENGAYQYTKEDPQIWDEKDIACIHPLPQHFQIPRKAFEILLGEMASPEAIAKLAPLANPSLFELRTNDPEFHAKILDEIVQMSCDEATQDSDDLLNVYAKRMNCTVRDAAQSILGSQWKGDDDKTLGLIVAFLIQSNYLKSGVPLESITFDAVLSEICKAVPGRAEYLKWAARIEHDKPQAAEDENLASATENEYV
jgi:hypothetical protein